MKASEKLNREYNKISKRYFQLEEQQIRSFEEDRELDKLEKRMAEICNLLEEA